MRNLRNEITLITVVTCDLCGKENQGTYTRVRQCKICKRDVCWQCSEHIDTECDLTEPYFHSDHPEYMCKPCWVNGTEIRNKIMEVRNKAEEEECELWEEWRKIKT